MSKTYKSTKKIRPQDELANSLRHQIETEELQIGDLLLPERQIAQTHGVSLRVVRESLARLEAEGLIERRQGRGTLICAKPESRIATTQKNIGVIFQNRIRDVETLEFFDVLQHTLQRGGYGTTVLVTKQDPAREVAIVEQLVKDRVPGIIVFSSHEASSSAHLQAAMDAGIKVCVFDHYFPELTCNFAGIDDRLAGFDAAAHLIRCGTVELVLINSSKDWTTHSLRKKGFLDAISKFAPHIQPHILNIPFDDMQTALKSGLRRILPHLNKGSVGIVAWWDHAAISAMEHLKAEGWNVPEDAAVIGFSNTLDSGIAEVPLTTMQIPRGDIARLSAYLLMDQIRNPKLEPQHIALRAPLVIRESCGCYQRHHTEASKPPFCNA